MDNRNEQYVLGDYIQAKFRISGKIIDAVVKIVDISNDGVGAVYNTNVSKPVYGSFDWDEFSPVVLCESDLEYIGFSVDESVVDDKAYFADWFPSNMRIYSYPDDGVFAVTSFSLNGGDVSNSDLTNIVFVKYVHELRRIFKVYGVEREVQIETENRQV